MDYTRLKQTSSQVGYTEWWIPVDKTSEWWKLPW